MRFLYSSQIRKVIDCERAAVKEKRSVPAAVLPHRSFAAPSSELEVQKVESCRFVGTYRSQTADGHVGPCVSSVPYESCAYARVPV